MCKTRVSTAGGGYSLTRVTEESAEIFDDLYLGLRAGGAIRKQRRGETLTREEREALHVKALAGLGRRDEARRAAAAFEDRFPRSVLLPAVRQISPHGG